MSSIDSVGKALYKIMTESDKKKPQPYDTKATVIRQDDNDPSLIWVHIPGGVAETPAQKTINAEPGDSVMIRISDDGTARVTGNLTEPPTGDKTAQKALKAAGTVQEKLEKIEQDIENGEFDGEDAEVIDTVWFEYCLSSSNTEFLPVNGSGESVDPEEAPWSKNMPEYKPGYFLWYRTATKLVLERDEESEDEGDEEEPIEAELTDEEGEDEEEGEYIIVYSEPMFYLAGQLACESSYLYNKDIRHFFWHDDTGAYVTTSEDSYEEGFATHAVSGSMELLYNGNPCTRWLPSGVSFYGAADGEYTDDIVASFGVGGINFADGVPFKMGNNNQYISWNPETERLTIKADDIWMGGQEMTPGGEWYTGTGITGTSMTPTVFRNSGVDYANTGDMYLNTSTNNTYKCTVEGDATEAKWAYVNNLKGAKGDKGDDGEDGQNAADYYCMQFNSKTGLNIYSGYYNQETYNQTYVNINSSSGMTFYVGGSKVASYGSSINLLGLNIASGYSSEVSAYVPEISSSEYLTIYSGGILKLRAREIQIGGIVTNGYYFNSVDIYKDDAAGNGNAIDFSNALSGDIRGATIAYVKSKTSSDKRLKEDIYSLKNDTTKLIYLYENLEPVRFRFKEGVLDDADDRIIKYGFIAQDVEQLIADYSIEDCDIIHEGESISGSKTEELTGKTHKKLEYDSLHALHVLYAQNLNERIVELEKQVKELQNGHH